MQLTLAEAQAAQLRQEKAQEEAAAAKRIDGECGVVMVVLLLLIA